MPTHPDAIGYLNDLAKEIDEPWFKMVCDLVAVSGVSTLDQLMLDTLIAFYTGRASYIGIKPAASAVAVSAPAVATDFLEHLSGFANFKLLCDTLELSFKKRVTLIFGANSSGKSSLCESLKVLATPGLPNRPLENVRATGVATPTFRFKFRSDAAPQMWTTTVGYGSRGTTVKYFDTAIAIQNVTNAVEPGRVIVLAPFKLHVFERVEALTARFREALQRAQQDNLLELDRALQAIRTDFAKFNTRPLAVIEDKTVSTLAAQIKLGETFKDQKLLGEKQAAVAELEKATSEEGLKLLQAEHRELESLLTSVNTLLISAEDLWTLDPANKAKTLSEKQAAQEALAKTLIPVGSTLDDLLALLRAAFPMCKMDEATGLACPLCRRDLGITEVDLFKQYHALLIGDLEKEINIIKGDIAKAGELATTVGQVDRETWDKYKTIPEEILSAAKTYSVLIVTNCGISKGPTVEAKGALESLKSAVTNWMTQLESKKTAIDTAAKGRDALVTPLTTLRTEIEPLEYAQAVADRLETLKAAYKMADKSQFWNAKLPTFRQVLKRVTERAKDAHEELVVLDFEARLDAEYKALAEKDMAAFGVKLARKGDQATVTVLPQVGGKDIDGILSEGEQRLHALALFFAELETCPQSVLVFDDPISSFDYNYIANYCTRLRDFTLKFSDRQIIILTHNWEFFVQLQTTLNQAGLNGHLSVHVLENCAIVADYSEKIDVLKNDINAILAAAGEPTKPKKEELAAKMRRLIEAVVNTHVFNHQRHQYKQKSQVVTEFQRFTKVVALLPVEATGLHDLYAKLSITEHDDPRAAYLNTDKTMFQTRYNQILDIETAIRGRIPP
ncbi:MAG: AAA family ATPase [Syntrophorhabdaceae bacterium]|nr:AAA family ATPase [Syntrophorhabdaceae bacterium]MDD5243074.1 AAA family ATPase [Syntrophorhabdaceae bacterium]